MVRHVVAFGRPGPGGHRTCAGRHAWEQLLAIDRNVAPTSLAAFRGKCTLRMMDTALSATATRERIRQVAEELYVLRGHDGFSFGDIAAAVGTTRANIHHHFGQKHELMRELVQGFAAERGAADRGHLGKPRPAIRQAHADADPGSAALLRPLQPRARQPQRLEPDLPPPARPAGARGAGGERAGAGQCRLRPITAPCAAPGHRSR